jgi:flagellar protein FliS
MAIQRYQSYLDHEVMTAEPVRLIQILYRAALDSIASARRHLKLGDIRARSRAISKTMAIITELSLSLDHAAGGDLSKNLAELYAYMQTLLIRANVEQSEPPLAEAQSLLSVLFEAWQSCLELEKPAVGAGVDAVRVRAYEPVSCAY